MLVRPDFDHPRHRNDVGADVALRQTDSLGRAGRARGEQQHAQRVRVDFERSERVRTLFAPLVPLADQAGDADGFVVALHLHDQTALERVAVQLGQRLDVPDDGFAAGFV